jgi:NTP pyrophosphatase (non-canonical NTP hydrolase)
VHDGVTLLQLQKHLDETCREKGWDKNSVSEVFMLFSEEIGELAKEIRLQTGLKNEKKRKDLDELRHEFADVLNYLLELANRFDIDLAEAYFEKHKINSTREWH